MSAKSEGVDEALLTRQAEARATTNPRKELVREQLIDIAAELFSTKGYAQTTFNDIARAIGLGRSAVYHYFRNKEEIVAALVEAEALTPSHQLQDLMSIPDLSPTERLRQAIVEGIKRRLSVGSRFLLLSRLESQIPEELGPEYSRGRRDIFEFYVRCINDGMASGEFRRTDPKIAAFAVIGMANWTSRWYSPTGARSPEEIAVLIADMALQGLVARDMPPVNVDALRGAVDQMRRQLDVIEQSLK